MSESGHPHDTPESIADSLRVVVADVETFVSDYLNRLSVAFENNRSKDRTQKVYQSVEDFEQEKTRWEQYRMLQEKEIQRKFDQLTEAWLRLEGEQRMFLQTKDQRESVQLSSGNAKNENIRCTSTDASSGAHIRSRESAVLQFQRLRQEIDASRPPVGPR